MWSEGALGMCQDGRCPWKRVDERPRGVSIYSIFGRYASYRRALNYGLNRSQQTYKCPNSTLQGSPPRLFPQFNHHLQMAVYPVHDMSAIPAHKRQRRTATSVLAGDFDSRLPRERDVLTSLLNGVPKYPAVEKVEEEEERRVRRKEKKEREQTTKKAKPAAKPVETARPVASTSASASAVASTTIKRPTPVPRAPTTTSAFWQARPAIHIATMQRSMSVTPPPMPSSPPSTPGPSISSGTSRTSSKRPRTPDDGEDIDDRSSTRSRSTFSPQPSRRPRKKRTAARKGWKGWVEGSPPPSDKLINLDVVTVLTERTTRSGKNFDAIGEGKDYWI